MIKIKKKKKLTKETTLSAHVALIVLQRRKLYRLISVDRVS